MTEHTEILMGVITALYLMVIAFIAWQGKRQIARIDGVEQRLTVIEENTNKAVNEMKENYKGEFINVRKDISDLKESNAEHFGEIKCSITELRTRMELKNGRSRS